VFPLRDVNPTRVRPLITMAIVIANLAVFFAWQPHTGIEAVTFLYERAAIPCEIVSGRPLTVAEIESGVCQTAPASVAVFDEKDVGLSAVVSLFLHGGLLHLAGNMWFLWVFGNNVEEAYGRIGYLLLYLLAGVGATGAYVALNPESTIPLVGASGAIAGVLGAYFILYPGHWLISLVTFYVLPVPAVIFLGLWFIGQFMLDQPGVAWEAHAAGFVIGMAVSLMLRGPLLRRVRRLHGAVARG
jgi:membrane associated rhomboid family serine protease